MKYSVIGKYNFNYPGHLDYIKRGLRQGIMDKLEELICSPRSAGICISPLQETDLCEFDKDSTNTIRLEFDVTYVQEYKVPIQYSSFYKAIPGSLSFIERLRFLFTNKFPNHFYGCDMGKDI